MSKPRHVWGKGSECQLCGAPYPPRRPGAPCPGLPLLSRTIASVHGIGCRSAAAALRALREAATYRQSRSAAHAVLRNALPELIALVELVEADAARCMEWDDPCEEPICRALAALAARLNGGA